MLETGKAEIRASGGAHYPSREFWGGGKDNRQAWALGRGEHMVQRTECIGADPSMPPCHLLPLFLPTITDPSGLGATAED